MDKPRNIDGRAVYIKRIRNQRDRSPVITIAIAEMPESDTFAVGVAICSPGESPSNNEGTRRAVGRCAGAMQGHETEVIHGRDLHYKRSVEDVYFMIDVGVSMGRLSPSIFVPSHPNGLDKPLVYITPNGIKFQKLKVVLNVPNKVKETLKKKQKILDGEFCKIAN